MLQYVPLNLQLFLSLVDLASLKYRRVLLGSVLCVNYSTVQRLHYANHDARNQLTIPISRSPQPISTREANGARVNDMSITQINSSTGWFYRRLEVHHYCYDELEVDVEFQLVDTSTDARTSVMRCR